MARQPRAQSSDNESQKENTYLSQQNTSAKVKMEKVKQGQVKVKAENAKRLRTRADRAEPAERPQVENGEMGDGEEDDDRDAEGDDDDSADEEGGSPKGRKRARVNSEGASRPSQLTTETERVRAVTLPRDVDGFIPGSIVRIQLRNFVTYDFVEFRPGPYLNMIIGPNGTGKSSIACAIAIGLNFPPEILGRAKEINSFVKIGTQDGHIEIELKAPKGKPNLVICRKLRADSKSSSYTLNGKPATGKEITNKVAELNVQVGNLCSFLPQDKVSSFAMMSSQQLLKETQKAAGDENLSNWHETLIRSGKLHSRIQDQIKDEDDQLRQMRERNEAIEREIERHNERKRIEREIALLELFIPCAEYRELRVKYTQAKDEQRRLHQKVKELKEKNAPAHALLNTLKTKHKECEKTREQRKKATQGKFDKLSRMWNENEKMEELAEELSSKLERIKQEERDRAQKITNLKAEIQRQREDHNRPLEVESVEVLHQEMRQLNLEKSDIISRRTEVETKLQTAAYTKEELNRQQDMSRRSLRELNSVDTQKLDNLNKWDRDTHDAILWLRQNQHQFKMEVIEPSIMSLTVPDKRYASAVESMFNATQLKTFVAQCREDLDTINRCLNDNPGLGRRARIATWFRDRAPLAPPPMTPEELQHLHFDGYLLNYVNCPEPLRWYLSMELQFHRTAVGLNGRAIDITLATQAVSRPVGGYSGGGTFIAGSTMNMVTRSRYGKRAVGNMTREIRPARNLIAMTIDADRKRMLDAEIAECATRLAIIDDELKGYDAESKQVEIDSRDLDKRYGDIDRRKKAIKSAQESKIKLKAAIERNVKKLKEMQDVPSAEEERQKTKVRLLNNAKKRAEIVKEYTELVKTIVVDQMVTTRIGLEFLQIGANKTALEELCKRKDEKHQKALQEFDAADKEFRRVKDASSDALERSRAALNEASEEFAQVWEEAEAKRKRYYDALEVAKQKKEGEAPSAEGVDLRTADQYKADLEGQRAQLELIHKTNPGVVEQYEKRKQDIEKLEETLAQRRQEAEKVEKNIKTARDRWQPALERLVKSIGEKFSAAFDRIGCAGEIRISENEDYDKWAIDILVKFRDEEKLQLLTGQRQSGGERSLTTILYLMSLTEQARAPFSLVDEINQGMDQRAERAVHDNMVEVTCKDDAAQYFLITPKLLPDLKYHERMKVLCVNNGEWLPEEKGLGDMMRMVKGYVNSRKERASTGH